MPSQLEQALNDIINIYHKYSYSNPSDDFLQLKEFKLLLKQHAQDFLRCTLPSGLPEDHYIEQLFQEADRNNSGRLHFNEFITTLARLAINAHNHSHTPGDKGHGHSCAEH